jgi:hypothetical protein
MTLLDSPGIWVGLVTLAGAVLALIHRRWGWVGFGLGSAILLAGVVAIGDHRVAVAPAITTPPRLNWLCIATPIPVAVAASLAVLAVTGAQLRLPKATVRYHLIVNVAVAAVSSALFIFLSSVVYVIAYLGCDTL